MNIEQPETDRSARNGPFLAKELAKELANKLAKELVGQQQVQA